MPRLPCLLQTRRKNDVRYCTAALTKKSAFPQNFGDNSTPDIDEQLHRETHPERYEDAKVSNDEVPEQVEHQVPTNRPEGWLHEEVDQG